MSHSRLKILTIVALSSWLGVMVFFGFVVAPTAFGVLEREVAGRLAMAIMPGYLWLGIGLGLGALFGSAGRLVRSQGSRTNWLGAALVGVASFFSLTKKTLPDIFVATMNQSRKGGLQ